MPSFHLTKTHIIYAAGIITLIGLLIGGAKVLIDHSGSKDVKKAVKENKRCQQLKAQGGQPYLDCQKEVDDLLSKLVADNELDMSQCKVNPDDKRSALCALTVWYFTTHIVTTEPGILQKVEQPPGQPIATGGRRKRGAEEKSGDKKKQGKKKSDKKQGMKKSDKKQGKKKSDKKQGKKKSADGKKQGKKKNDGARKQGKDSNKGDENKGMFGQIFSKLASISDTEQHGGGEHRTKKGGEANKHGKKNGDGDNKKGKNKDDGGKKKSKKKSGKNASAFVSTQISIEKT